MTAGDEPFVLGLVNFHPLLHLVQRTSPVHLIVRLSRGGPRRPLVRPRRDAVGLQDGAGRGDQAVPRANTGGQHGGGARRRPGWNPGHGRRSGDVVQLWESGGCRVGGEGGVRVHFKRGGADGVLQHGGGGRVFVAAAALLGVAVDRLQEDLVDEVSAALRVRSLGVGEVVCLPHGLLLHHVKTLQLLRTVERKAGINVSFQHLESLIPQSSRR